MTNYYHLSEGFGSQIVIITNFVVVLSVSIKRVVCSKMDLLKFRDKYGKELNKYSTVHMINFVCLS